jgi:hypothetical protein
VAGLGENVLNFWGEDGGGCFVIVVVDGRGVVVSVGGVVRRGGFVVLGFGWFVDGGGFGSFLLVLLVLVMMLFVLHVPFAIVPWQSFVVICMLLLLLRGFRKSATWHSMDERCRFHLPLEVLCPRGRLD